MKNPPDQPPNPDRQRPAGSSPKPQDDQAYTGHTIPMNSLPPSTGQPAPPDPAAQQGRGASPRPAGQSGRGMQPPAANRSTQPTSAMPSVSPAPRPARRIGQRVDQTVTPPLLPSRAAQQAARQQRKGGWQRWLRRFGVGVVITLLLACVGLFLLQQSVAGKVVVPDVRADQPVRGLLTSPSNILLLGVDLRPDHPEEGVRSDTLLLLHLDPSGWASLLTVPRDSLATIPGYGEAKINRAFTEGYNNAATPEQALPYGMAVAADTVENFLQLRQLGSHIDYVATVNFDGFAAMIDALGGIDIDVPFRIVDNEYPTPDFGTMQLVIEAGPQQMDGARALQYVRTRHADSDFGRGERQQQVLQAMSTALRNKPLVTRPFVALRVVNAASGAIQTTMPVGRLDALLLALQLARFDPAAIAQYRLNPETVAVSEEGSDLRWDGAGVQQLTSQLFTRPGEAQEQAVVQVQNGTDVVGLAGRITTALINERFTIQAPDDAAATPRSQIIVYGNKPFTQRRLQQLLRNMPVTTRPASEAPPGVQIVIVLGDDYASFIEP